MPQPKVLQLTRFGNPILRKISKQFASEEIASVETQQLIADIRHTNKMKDYGVGIAAPQVGKSVALSVIDIKPSSIRPDVPSISMVIINPTYEGMGRRTAMWEGCLSSGKGHDVLFGKALRWKKIRACWIDEYSNEHSQILDGITAHVFQHETDHLNGILFVDKVRDSMSYMLEDEYRKRILKK